MRNFIKQTYIFLKLQSAIFLKYFVYKPQQGSSGWGIFWPVSKPKSVTSKSGLIVVRIICYHNSKFTKNKSHVCLRWNIFLIWCSNKHYKCNASLFRYRYGNFTRLEGESLPKMRKRGFRDTAYRTPNNRMESNILSIVFTLLFTFFSLKWSDCKTNLTASQKVLLFFFTF